MSGATLPIIPKQFLDFSTLATGSQEEFVIADRLLLLHWRELTLTVRVHSHTVTGTNLIFFKLYPQSWTTEDPGIPFTTFNTPNAIDITSSTPSPGLMTLSIPTLGAFASGAITSMARVTVVGQRNSTGTIQATVSLVLSTKDA